mmetsp:Transcript_8091/g.50023  ORF Transcript_8091/g.50023 Transcript_8091/m.50023 type:complete len:342 (+) Transcript_8091:5447-6472(+)
MIRHFRSRNLSEMLQTMQNVLQCGTDEEVLLFEAEHLPSLGGVVGIENTGDRFGFRLFLKRFYVLSLVEDIQLEFVHGHAPPQPHRVGMSRTVPWNRRIVSHGPDRLSWMPFVLLAALLTFLRADPSIKVHGIGKVSPLHLPWIATPQPWVGFFPLLATMEHLFKHPEAVAQSISPRREFQGGHRIQEATSQSSKSSIPQARICFLFHQVFQVDSQLHQGQFEFLVQLEVAGHLLQCPSCQKLQGQVSHLFVVVVLVPCTFQLRLSVGPGFQQPLVQDLGHGLVGFVRMQSSPFRREDLVQPHGFVGKPSCLVLFHVQARVSTTRTTDSFGWIQTLPAPLR